MVKEIKVYNELSVDDIEKFEEGLIRWSGLEGQKSHMLFEEKSLEAVRSEMGKISGYGYGIIYTYPIDGTTKRMETPSLTISWDYLTENKCILKTIIFKMGREELYSAPDKWEETQLWYGC